MTPWIQLHLLAERQGVEGWTSLQKWVSHGPLLIPKNPLYFSRRDTESLPLFAVLGGPWRKMLAPERDVLSVSDKLPENMSDLVRNYSYQYDPKSAGVVSVKDVQAYPWRTSIERRVSVSKRAYDHWETTGIVPQWAHTESDGVKTQEVIYKIEAEELWGPSWLRNSLPRIEALDADTTRLVVFFTEEYHGRH